VKLRLPITERMIRVLIFGSIFASGCLYALEKAAQAVEVSWTIDPHEIPATIQPHPYLLWDLPPGDTEVNGHSVHINAVGSRGPDTTWAKPTGTRRVLALGDGVVFGEGVQRDSSFVVDAVNALGGTRVGVETLLLAVPGYSILQQRNLMDLRGWTLEPNVLIINGPGIDMGVAPYVDEDILTPVRSRDTRRAKLEQLASFRILNHHMQVTGGQTAQKRSQVFTGKQNLNKIGRPRVGVNAYARHLDAITASAIERGIGVVYVIYPVPEDLNDSHMTERVSLYRSAMIDVARRNGVSVVDGPEVFKKSGRDKARLFNSARLLSEYGHRTLGYALSGTLRKWMRGRRILGQGTGESIPHYREPALLPPEAP
jgi:hypothetical protein